MNQVIIIAKGLDIFSDLSIFLSETDKNKIYKVLIGPFQNLKGAKNIADNLTKLGYTNIILNEKDNQ